MAEDDPFGQVWGGRLTIKAAYLSWNDPPSREEGQSAAANMRKFVAELLAQPGTELNAETSYDINLMRDKPRQSC